MAVASGPAGPVLAGPVFTFPFKIAHAQTISNDIIIINNYALSITSAALPEYQLQRIAAAPPARETAAASSKKK